MKVSLQSAQSLTDTDITAIGVNEIVKKVGAQLGAIEEVIDWSARFNGIVIAKVTNCQKHPNADKLSLCLIDDGGVVKDVKRDENGFVQVVCGAPNVQTGQTVVWLPPGVTVPATYSDSEPFVLGSRELRGIVSNGMIASPKELGISDDHNGILVIDNDIKPGTLFKAAFQLNDSVLDLENKMFTHRPDCFGTLGVARELAGIQHKRFVSPQWYLNEPVYNQSNKLNLSLKVNTTLVPRFSAVVVDNIKVGPSPLWMQIDLAKAGIRPINNIVDITNWIMHTTAQPLHAYDYHKILASGKTHNANLTARMSKKGDNLNLLNGKSITLEDDSTILICANDTPVGVGGVMGGADTEVDENTKAIIIEAANFDMYSIRRTAMKLGLFTDAVTRFNKGQSPLQTTRALKKALDLTIELAGGVQASPLTDVADASVKESPNVSVDINFINQRLGTKLSSKECQELLNNVEFQVTLDGDNLDIKVPFWRQDIHIKEDLVEEIGRLYGYDKLSIELPKRHIKPTKKDALRCFKQEIRDSLKSLGVNELLTYSFVHQKLLEAANQNPDNSYKLSNALSPALQYYRQSLTPSLLEKVHPNIKAGYDKFALYEIGKGHDKLHPLDVENLPYQQENLALVFASKETLKGAAYYYARTYLDALADKLNIKLSYKPVKDSEGLPTIKPFNNVRIAAVHAGEKTIGYIGEYHANTKKLLKLPSYCAGFEINIAELLTARQGLNYRPISKYPSVTQDISLKVLHGVSYGDLHDSLIAAIDKNIPQNSVYTFEPIDIYQENQEYKHFTFRLNISSYDTTLKSEEINALLDTVAKSIQKSHSATRI
jgi:phenylalanyl-tRNA synthetase beta chain